MFKRYKGLSHTVFFIILVLLASCKPVYHLAKVEKSSQSVQPGAIDTKVDQSIAPYRNQLTEAMETVIGRCTKTMIKDRPESPLGNWFGDALVAIANTVSSSPVDFAVQNFGGIRISNLTAGPVKVGTIYELMPFDNYLIILTLDSTELIQFINHMAASGGWPISKGITYSIRDGHAENILLNGEAIRGDRGYRVALPDYVANGGDNCDFFKDNPQETTGLLIRDGLIQYVKEETEKGHTIDAVKDGRVKLINE